MATETEKLRSALRMCAAALQAACQPGRPLRESDTITDGGGSRMTLANILDAADDALGGGFAEQPAAQEAERPEGSVPPRWYSIGEIEHLLRRMSYSEQIIAELAPWFHRHLQASFNKGFDKGRTDRPAERPAAEPDFLPDGTRVEWEDNFGMWHAGTIIGYAPAAYSAELDDGVHATGYARGRFRRLAAREGQ